MTDYASTVIGGVRTAAVTARTPALMGFSSDSGTVTGDFTWDFLDWPFEPEADPSRRQHVLFAQAHRPKLAVAPDIRNESQSPTQVTLSGESVDGAERNSLPANLVMDVADELDQYARTVIIVPTGESFPVEDVPDRYRVGVPTSSAFDINTVPDDLLFAPERYDRHPGGVHLLGGGPQRQLSLREHFSDIRSVDTSFTSGRAIKNGLVWDGETFRRPDEQPEWLADLEFYAKMYVSQQTYAHSWGMVDLLRRKGVQPRGDESKTDALLRAAMVGGERDIEAIALDLLPDGIANSGNIHIREDNALVVLASARKVTEEELVLFSDALHDFGFRNIQSEGTRGGVAIIADPPNRDPDTSAWGLRPQ